MAFRSGTKYEVSVGDRVGGGNANQLSASIERPKLGYFADAHRVSLGSASSIERDADDGREQGCRNDEQATVYEREGVIQVEGRKWNNGSHATKGNQEKRHMNRLDVFNVKKLGRPGIEAPNGSVDECTNGRSQE